jgi:transcriptional regulator with XRE-family HTH domain
MGNYPIGELLKRRREELGLSQRNMAGRLQYKNVNFMSMLETGVSAIPLLRIPDIVQAYELPRFVGLAMLHELHPDAWNVVSQLEADYMKESEKGLQDGLKGLEKEVLEKLDALMGHYAIPIGGAPT